MAKWTVTAVAAVLVLCWCATTGQALHFTFCPKGIDTFTVDPGTSIVLRGEACVDRRWSTAVH